MPRNLALFCDGTWQDASQTVASNVSRLARMVAPCTGGAAEGEAQVVYYDNGVGVGGGVLDRSTKVLGGAFGLGLDAKLVAAYQFLCLNYRPGDRIFVFGWSRGAYTARSLIGLLKRVWIVRREHLDRAAEALRIYREAPRPGAFADAAAFKAADRRYIVERCKAFADAYGWPGLGPIEGCTQYRPSDPDSLLPPSPATMPWVQYVGVWDTVGSLGVPPWTPFASGVNGRYAFHDQGLSRLVRSARHAVAIDERRKVFAPTLWDNLEGEHGMNWWSGAEALPTEQQPYQELWFPGDHGAVGGGGLDRGLSAIALLWVAEGAARAGLTLDPRQLEASARAASATEPFGDEGFKLSSALFNLTGLAERSFEEHRYGRSIARRDLAAATLARLAARGDYRPGLLDSLTRGAAEPVDWRPR